MEFIATNHFVYVIRDESEKTVSGFVIPGQGIKKQSTGTIYSAGSLAQDVNIKKGKGKKVKFFDGTGFPQEIEGVEYLVLTADQITGIEK